MYTLYSQILSTNSDILLNNTINNQQQEVSCIHPLQILLPSSPNLFALSPFLVENKQEDSDQPSFSPIESYFYEKEQELNSLASSDVNRLNEDDLDCVDQKQDMSYETDDDEQDSDWEKPSFKRSKKSRQFTSSLKKTICSHTECDNCQITKTPLWRRSPEGKILCNACGLFLKLHGVIRPLSLKSDIIKRRNRSGSTTGRHKRSNKKRSHKKV
ncbi:hypothetical protein G6F46_010509 [Rhizopus delemar]|uniref:GATA-type domain-containing protein n=3 Tax=Rhizopus TaxID=4842 RepID=I1BIC3_RHIO9|nr:hypothetical protein RO3G_00657 [Rhizopus delemar RA 99-880]KAG1450512.1 hypothetical protein G6F55_009649 [Rhizopus delemar]KAG1549195.1 hypothetical protein G6F51_003207 [Rhizopus arrhizus]KAG1492720.1 hypothetical protein G6F54_009102 [Rhizopus delemar]KAG1507632.1 hypothetical protein G6F53_008801 [Rhizopus delemar]|eukprot:EIE75953.1 hypothetical protein RO3G_00657 [Rhizopus delemar RA 99-880]